MRDFHFPGFNFVDAQVLFPPQTFEWRSASILITSILWLGTRQSHVDKEVNLKASILIVSDDPVLLHTRAELLRDWRIVGANSREAKDAVLTRNYDLLIFCQTVQEKVVRSLIDLTLQLHPESKTLTIRSAGERPLKSATYEVELNNPGGLRSTVAKILEALPTAVGV